MRLNNAISLLDSFLAKSLGNSIRIEVARMSHSMACITI